MKIKTLLFFLICCPLFVFSQKRWQIQPDGSILWQMDCQIPHYDHIEMSGEQLSTVLRYGVDKNGSFRLERSVIWPLLRTLPNNTHASLMQRFAIDYASLLMVNGLSLNNEKVKSLRLDGKLTVISEFATDYANSASIKTTIPEPVVELPQVPIVLRYNVNPNRNCQALYYNLHKSRLV